LSEVATASPRRELAYDDRQGFFTCTLVSLVRVVNRSVVGMEMVRFGPHYPNIDMAQDCDNDWVAVSQRGCAGVHWLFAVQILFCHSQVVHL
jgi:hypothetical protein